MTKEELKYIQLLFRLHTHIMDGIDNELTKNTRDEMEVIDRKYLDNDEFVEQMNIISSFCYGLTFKDPELLARYRKLLFADSVDSVELDEIFSEK